MNARAAESRASAEVETKTLSIVLLFSASLRLCVEKTVRGPRGFEKRAAAPQPFYQRRDAETQRKPHSRNPITRRRIPSFSTGTLKLINNPAVIPESFR